MPVRGRQFESRVAADSSITPTNASNIWFYLLASDEEAEEILRYTSGHQPDKTELVALGL